MSVPVNQRKPGKLEVCIKAHDLCCYVLQITKNKKIFTEDYQSSLTDKIVSLAIEIHMNVWGANNVLVKKEGDLVLRRQLQDEACIKCNILLSLIDIAKTIFHLDTKRVVYWGKKTIEVRNLIRSWKQSDNERYKKLLGM